MVQSKDGAKKMIVTAMASTVSHRKLRHDPSKLPMKLFVAMATATKEGGLPSVRHLSCLDGDTFSNSVLRQIVL